MELLDFIQALPKAELHLHIEGSLEPELMFELALRNGVTLPYASVEETRAAYAFTDLQSFLDIYYAGAAVLLHERDFYELAMAYYRHAKADGVVHAEIFFDPQTHTSRGIAFETMLDGLERAARDAKAQWGISTRLILCFLRHLPEEAGFRTLEQALPHIQRIHGVGLDSSEKGHPPAKFQRLFAKCRALGLHLVAHAGEEGPASYIQDALDLLNVERIDHGVRAVEDPVLVARLAREKIALTVCPLSNIKLCVFPDLGKHTLKQLLDQGVRITLNSDDPAYFGGYIGQNYLETTQALKLTRSDLKILARNSLLASFVSDEERAPWLAALGAFAAED
jgi:adenosine deaminase